MEKETGSDSVRLLSARFTPTRRDNALTHSHNERWRLTGKHALVTGGTKGIGYAVAQELLHLGATVTIAARTQSDLDSCVTSWRENGCDAHGITADLSTPDSAATLISAMGSKLDILVNNVGRNIRKPTTEYSADEYRAVLETNLASAFHLCRAAYPLLAQSENASVVNIGSVAGSVAVLSGLPYAMTKAALDQMTRYLAVEWAQNGIRVNAVNPWYTNTPLAAPRLSDPAFVERVLAVTPLKRIADPADIAGAVAFLCLPVARHITGQCLAVDGGFLALGLE